MKSAAHLITSKSNQRWFTYCLRNRLAWNPSRCSNTLRIQSREHFLCSSYQVNFAPLFFDWVRNPQVCFLSWLMLEKPDWPVSLSLPSTSVHAHQMMASCPKTGYFKKFHKHSPGRALGWCNTAEQHRNRGFWFFSADLPTATDW